MDWLSNLWKWLINFFNLNQPHIPVEVIDESTATVEPEEFDQEEVEALLDELDDELDEPTIVEEIEVRDPSKFAVIIGINKYDPSLDADLNGCVNDAQGMYEVLTETYGFPHDNVRVLTDFRATSDNIFERIEWLLSHNVPGDELVLHYSGHGSQVRDRDGDELDDYLDEILCPTDLDWDDPFTDDLIAGLFKTKADGVFLTFICDACHSATMSRSLAFTTDNKKEVPKFINPPLDVQLRSQDFGDNAPLNKIGKSIDENGYQDHVMLSGCRDDQTSSDAYIDGRWQGALTASLIEAIKKNPNRDWVAIHAEVVSILNASGYSQRPQLSGDNGLIQNRNIFGV